MSWREARDARATIRWIIGSSIVEAGAVFIPLQRKICSLTWQFSQKGDSFSCKALTRGGWRCGDGSDTGGVRMGFTVILICLIDGLAMELISGNLLKGNWIGTPQLCPMRVHLKCCFDS